MAGMSTTASVTLGSWPEIGQGRRTTGSTHSPHRPGPHQTAFCSIYGTPRRPHLKPVRPLKCHGLVEGPRMCKYGSCFHGNARSFSSRRQRPRSPLAITKPQESAQARPRSHAVRERYSNVLVRAMGPELGNVTRTEPSTNAALARRVVRPRIRTMGRVGVGKEGRPIATRFATTGRATCGRDAPAVHRTAAPVRCVIRPPHVQETPSRPRSPSRCLN